LSIANLAKHFGYPRAKLFPTEAIFSPLPREFLLRAEIALILLEVLD
jgi:hypothetical protein